VRPGSPLFDQPIAHGARERDVRERAALAGIVQMPELAPADLEHGTAEARLGRELNTLPARDLSHDRVDEPIGHGDIMQLQVHLKSM
jgi:hypothetical protein